MFWTFRLKTYYLNLFENEEKVAGHGANDEALKNIAKKYVSNWKQNETKI